MEEPDLFVCPSTEVAISLDKSDPLLWEKEAIYEGEFETKGQRFRVKPKTLDHWKTNIELFLERGLKIPMPVGHTTDPEKKRAEVVGVRRAKNSKGKESLYLRFKFLNAKAAEELKNSDISIYSPHSHKDGLGREYTWPITHAAFTDYPTIPELEGFQAIAASLVPVKELSMSLQTIAEQMGISVADKKDPELEKAILDRFQEMQAQVEELAAANGAGSESSSSSVSDSSSASSEAAVAASLLGILKDKRILQLDKLVADGKITPAVRKELEKKHCGERQLALALSNDGGPTAFDSIVEMFSKNDSILSLGKEKTRQPSGRADGKSSLVADAERRSKK